MGTKAADQPAETSASVTDNKNSKWDLASSSLKDVQAVNLQQQQQQRQDRVLSQSLIPKLELMLDDANSAGSESKNNDDLRARVKDCDQRKDGDRTAYYDKNGDLMGWEVKDKLYVVEWNGDNLQRVLSTNGHVLEYDSKRSLSDGQWQWKNENGVPFDSKRWQNCFIQTDESGKIVNRFPGAVTKEMMRDMSVASYADLPQIADNFAQTIGDLREGNSRNGAATLALELLQMSPDKLQQLALQYQNRTGRTLGDDVSALARDGYITQPMNTYLQNIISTGAQERTAQQICDLAKLALSVDDGKWFYNQHEDKVALLQATIGGADQNQIEARKLFMDQGGEKRLLDVFGEGAELNQSKDILQNGRVSAVTKINRDAESWLGVNENSLRQYISSMPVEDRQKYLTGRDIANSGRKEGLTSEEQSAVDFYQNLDTAMRKSSALSDGFITRNINSANQNLRVYYGLTDQIQFGNENGLISKITKANGNFEQVRDAIMNMSEDDFNRFRYDKKYKAQVRTALNSTYFDVNGTENFRSHNLLNDIEAKPNYKDASKYGADKLYSMLDQNYKNPPGVADSIDNADSQAIDRIRKDPEYLKRLQARANANTEANSPERELVTYQINMYKSGRQRDAVDNLTIEVLKMQYSHASRASVIAHVGAAIKANPALTSSLKSDERGTLVLKYLKNATGSDDIAEKILTKKPLSSDDLFKLTSYREVKINPKTGMPTSAPPETKTNSEDMFALLPYSDAKQMDMSGLNAEQRKIANNIDGQEDVKQEDRLRLLALKGSVASKDVAAIVGDMKEVDKLQMLKAYADKYGVQAKDSLTKVATSDLDGERIRQLLSPTPKTVVGVVSNNLRANSIVTNVGDAGQFFTNALTGGDTFSAANQQAANTTAISRTVQKALDKATPEQRADIDNAITNLERAVNNVDHAKKESVAKVERAALRVAMAAGAVLMFPVSAPVTAALVSVCIAAGVGEVVSRRLIEGGKYSNDKAMQDGVNLGLNLALNLAPYAVARLFKSPTVTTLLKDGVKEEQFASELKIALNKGANATEQEAALKTVIAKYAREGQEEKLIKQLSDNYSSEIEVIARAKQKIKTPKNEELAISPKDSVSKLPVTRENVSSVANLKEDGDAIQALRTKYKDLHVNVEPRANQNLLDQQNLQFQKTMRLDGKILDGAVINGVTVDKNEPLIRDLLTYAKAKYGHLPPDLRAEAYTRFAKTAFQQESEGIAQVYARNLRDITRGEQPYLGDFAKLNSGVCFEESLFLKLLGDQHKDWQVSLVGGISAKTEGYRVAAGSNPNLNHAWTEFKFKPGDAPKIYDPRQVVFGETYDQMLVRLGTTHVPGQKAVIAGMPDAIKVESQGDKLFQMKGFDPHTGEAIVYESRTGFVPKVTVYDSVKSLEEAGWVSSTPELYVRKGKACMVSVQPDGKVLMFETPALKKFPAKDINWQIDRPAPLELNSTGSGGSLTPVRPPFKKGDSIKVGDENYQVAGFDNQSSDVIVYQEGRGRGNAATFPRMKEGDLGTKYQPIRINGKEYLRDVKGNVFSKAEGENPLLFPETEFQVVSRSKVKVSEPIAEKPALETPDLKLTSTPEVSPVSEKNPVEFVEKEIQLAGINSKFSGYEFGVKGETVDIWRNLEGWYVPAKRPFIDAQKMGSVKVDVTAVNLDDARKVQEYLIPLLEKEPAFAPPRLLGWKTTNPANARAGGSENLMGQNAKVFTLYCDNPADAIAIQKKVDEALKNAGLGLEAPPNSGNVFKISGESNRVGMVRDTFTQSVDSKKYEPVINLDSKLSKSIESEFGKGKQLTTDELNSVMKKVGIREENPPIMFYDSNGKLSMRVSAGKGDHHDYSPSGVYVTEAKSGREVGNLTDRPALYKLYERYDIDPVNEALLLQQLAEKSTSTKIVGRASINGQSYEVNKVILVGRSNDAQIKITAGAETVSREHAAVFTDLNGNTYIADLGSTNGTFVNGKKIAFSSDSNKPNWVRIERNDKVTLGNSSLVLEIQ